MNPKLKLLIPNILTSTRLVFSPIIIILGVTKNYRLALLFVLIASISDFFDGRLARKWNTVTETGARLDAISDKVFSISILMYLSFKFKVFVSILFLEILIGGFNLFSYYKTNKHKVLSIGKIKTTFLFSTMAFAFVALFTNAISKLIPGLGLTTLNIQILTLISYLVYYYDFVKNKELEESIIEDKSDTRVKIYDIEEKPVKEEKEYTSDTKVITHIKDIFNQKDED